MRFLEEPALWLVVLISHKNQDQQPLWDGGS